MPYRILDINRNKESGLDALLDVITRKDIIYIGEFHQVPEILQAQIDIIAGLVFRGLTPSLCLEIFNVLQQKILDYYSAGIIPFEQVLDLYRAGPEGFDLNHYAGLIDTAVKNRLKIICLNIPKTVASAVAKHGPDKQELAGFHIDENEIINCSREYKKAIGSIYRKHPHKDITEENFIFAQAVKDEMMAETIVYYLTTETAGVPLVVISGRGHVENRLGIPERVRKKLGGKGKSASDVLIVATYEDERLKQGTADYAILI